jgi:hypothetical protein
MCYERLCVYVYVCMYVCMYAYMQMFVYVSCGVIMNEAYPKKSAGGHRGHRACLCSMQLFRSQERGLQHEES